MSKRKRDSGSGESEPIINSDKNGNSPKIAKTNGHIDVKTHAAVIQIVTGSYERVLHGVSAYLSGSAQGKAGSAHFADTFLFNAHGSAIRCLALSPLPNSDSSDTQGVYLASGGTDERINVYSLASSPPGEDDKMPLMPSLGSNKISEDPRNRELGSLMQHSSSITALHFPTRSKLMSASEDNTIAISRTKDLTVVSTVKAPNPKALGQPSGDTAPVGVTPAGVNDFAVHPSMKLMVSVGRGEKCMRLWNLVTGKKAGVLNFGREILQSVKEAKHSAGEGRRIRWHPNGTEFVVAFERGAVVFGEDSKPKRKALPEPLTKLQQVQYITLRSRAGEEATLLAVSTEDGRILFYSTSTPSEPPNGWPDSIPDAEPVAEMGGKIAGFTGRIKDFEIIQLPAAVDSDPGMVIITASSDGALKVWYASIARLTTVDGSQTETEPFSTLLGTYETGSRITCMKAFLMQPAVDGGLSEFEGLTTEAEDSSSGSGSESD